MSSKKSLMIIKKTIKSLIVYKKEKIINQKIITMNQKTKIRKWDFDMEGNPYYCDGKAT